MTKSDIVLIRPQEHGYHYLQWHEDIYLAYLLPLIEKSGYKYRVFDYSFRPLTSTEEMNNAVSQIAETNPQMVVFVVDKHPTNNPYYAYKMIDECNSHPRLNDAFFVAYGNTQVGYERFLKDVSLDCIVIGEETDFISLVDQFFSNRPYENLPGVAVRTRNDDILANKPLSISFDLDKMPFPGRYYFTLPKHERNDHGYVAAILGSRGCYAKCNFCNIRAKEDVFGTYPWRGRTPSNIVDEIEVLYTDYGVRDFSFVDPQFFAPGTRGQRRANEISKAILDRNIRDISFGIYSRADDIERDTIYSLKRAGLYTVFLGIESFSQNVLDRYNKKTKVEKNISAIKTLLDADIRVRLGLIMYDYFTGFTEIKQNISALKELTIEKSHLLTLPLFFQNILTPLDDTPISEKYQSIKGCSGQVFYDFPQQFTEQQKRLSRCGKISAFSDRRIAFLCEATRILSSQLLKRSNLVELSIAKDSTQESDRAVYKNELLDLDSALSWMNNLTAFALDRFSQLSEKIEKECEMSATAIDTIGKRIYQDCDNYDRKHLGHCLKHDTPTLENFYD